MPKLSEVQNGLVFELIERMDWDDYRAYPGLNPSTIVHGVDSMKHLKAAWNKEFKDSDDLLWGRAVHCLLLEPHEFEGLYARAEKRRSRADDGVFRDEEGREVLLDYRYDNAINAANSFLADEMIQRTINRGVFEATLLCVEEGLQCKGRVDWIDEGRAIVDVKTTRNLRSRPFGRDFYKFGYDIKLGLYQRWLQRLTDRHWPVEVICLENVEPYDCTVIPIDDNVLDRGARKGLEIIKRVKRAIEEDRWPGIAGGDYYFLDTPGYEMEDELTAEVKWDE